MKSQYPHPPLPSKLKSTTLQEITMTETPTQSTFHQNNVTVPHNPQPTTPTLSPATKNNVTVCTDVVPAGLSKYLSRDRKFAKISNNKFSKTKILRKWKETKLESGAKFTIQPFLEYKAPIISTRPPKIKNKKKNILVNWPPRPPPPKGVKSASKKRKSFENDNVENQKMTKMLKITPSSTKTMNTPLAGKKYSSSGNPKNEFGKIKQMFLNLESKTANINYSNKNANNPIGQPYASKIIANHSERSTEIPETDLGK